MKKNNELNKFGYYYLEIVEQRGQYMAVLPERIGTKTVFALCHKCAERTIVDGEEAGPPGSCKHEDAERAKHVFLPSPEINLALKHGAKILRIFEVHEFQETKELFKSYVKRWYRLKIIGGGTKDYVKWKSNAPAEHNTIEHYCQEIKDRFDIAIDPREIGAKNEILRTTAKLCLNSLWGKYSMRMKPIQTVRCADKEEFLKLLDQCDADEYDDFQLEISPTCMTGKVTLFQNQLRENMHVNPYIAMSTTSNARIRLYELFEACGFSNVMYGDTDSCFYTGDRIPYGVFLGESADELEGGFMRDIFASRAPKDYFFSYENAKKETKHKFVSKGLAHTKDTVDFVTENMQDMILESLGVADKPAAPRAVKQVRFDKDYRGGIVTSSFAKAVKCDYDKRVPCDPIFDDLGNLLMIDTLPYGY